VKHVLKQTLWSVLALALGLSPLTLAGMNQVAAQDQEPVAVVSVAATEQLLKEISYLTEAAGAADFGRLVTLLASPYTAALDKTKPWGVYVLKEGETEFSPVGFVPAKDVQIWLATFEQQIGKPQDVGDGVLEIASDKPQPVFVKQKGNWAFLTNKKSLLANLPDDPTKMLGGLDQKYTMAVRINLSKLPGDWRKMAIEQMRNSFEERMSSVKEEEQKQVKALGESLMSSVVQLVEGLEQFTFGWKIDAEQKTTFMEFGLTAVPGSELAKQMTLVRAEKSAFAGFLLPGAAATLHVTGKSSKQEIQQAQLMLKSLREAAMKGIAEDTKLADDQERKRAQKIVGQFLDLFEDTVKLGKIDAGAVLMLQPDAMNFAIGGSVSDGKKLADAAKKLAKFAQEKSPEFPDIKFDAQTYQGVTFHTVGIPLPGSQEPAQKLLGDTLQLIIGTGAKSAYLAAGKEPESLLKQVIDKSKADANKELPPAEFMVALTPIVETVAALQDNPQVKGVLDTLKQAQGKDHILIRTNPSERGVVCRLELEGGVLRVLGDVARTVVPLIQAAFPQ
jgi:hypothetical protein